MSTTVPAGEMELSGALKAMTNSSWLARKFLPGTFLVNVEVNSRKVSLVIDTGSGFTVLSPQAALGAKVTLKETDKVGKAIHWGKEVPIYSGRIRELRIEGLVARNVPIGVLGLQPTLKLLSLPVYHLDGFLGIDLLKHLAIDLDLQKGIITFSRGPLPMEAKVVPSASLQLQEIEQQIDEQRGVRVVPIVEGVIDDRGPFQFFIDTGTSAPALVGEEVWQALGLGEDKKVTLEGVQLGTVSLEKVPAVKGSGAEFWKDVILLGNNIFLANGYKHLTLDFLAGKLYAER